LLPGLGASPFDDPGEGQQAEITREMMTGGDWITLRLNGVRYFDKPPVLYWLSATSFWLLGSSEAAARLAPLLGVTRAVAATALLGARLSGASGGLIAAGALLSSVLFIAFGRYFRPETLFVAAIQWGFTGLIIGLVTQDRAARRSGSRPDISQGIQDPSRTEGHGWTLVGCAALGAASLIKDPLGLVGPLLAIGFALALAGRARPVSAWLPWG